ncbi:hypothetical protein pdam_00004037 [Pocillopora damicornis]|uniref:Uncharacterized protein n=1 Tax=Pocillopora damicornis TaxID=46731 RepID=A0A3M6UCB6_POCDA|nr:hypothetical protein pdam_00004037 [Pocillopora damicornis]
MAGRLPQTYFNAAYFVLEKDLSSVLRSSGTKGEKLAQVEEIAIQRFNSSVRFKDGKYEVSMPWKSDVTALPNNYDMALNRSLSTEKRLLKDSLLSGSAAMHTRKWLSNLQKVLQKILEVDRAVKVDFYMRNLPSEKTLDILWLAREDLRSKKTVEACSETCMTFLELMALIAATNPQPTIRMAERAERHSVVLMLAPDTSYEQWPLGRVLEVYPEAEGHVGAVKLQTGRNVLFDESPTHRGVGGWSKGQ